MDQFDQTRAEFSNVKQVIDYQPGDHLEIWYQAEMDRAGNANSPEVTLAQNSDASGALILFNGKVIAEVIDGLGITEDQIRLIASEV